MVGHACAAGERDPTGFTIADPSGSLDDDSATIVLDAESENPTLTTPPLALTIGDSDVTPVPALPGGQSASRRASPLFRTASIFCYDNDR